MDFMRILRKFKIVAFALIFLCPATFAASTSSTLPAQQVKSTAVAKERMRIWNLQNADILAVIPQVANMTGRNFIVDPRVSGRVTVVSTRPMTTSEIYQVFLSSLQTLGYDVNERTFKSLGLTGFMISDHVDELKKLFPRHFLTKVLRKARRLQAVLFLDLL